MITIDNHVYILNLDGKYLINNKFKSDDKYFDGTLPYSLELIKLTELYPEEIYKKGNKQYSKAIINVTFNKAIHKYSEDKINLINKKTGKVKKTMKKDKTLLSTVEIRKQLYTNGFNVDGVKYVLFKRSSSKARIGSALFIKENLYDEMIEWSRIGIKFDDTVINNVIDEKGNEKQVKGEEVDIASLKAYESLTLSSIEDIVVINPDEILLIDDVDGKFKTLASITKFNEEGNLVTSTQEIDRSNSIWDGQSLGDVSLFKDKSKGMMLLRNRFFKSCAFNTNLQKFFSDPENNITEVIDMFGKVMDASKIKLVITPNSLKLFKFAYKIGTLEETYKYWLNNLEVNFGVCKHEKPSKFDKYNKLSYQMLNSIPFTMDDIKELMQDELDYVKLLKNDLKVFKHHISNYDISCTREFIYNLLSVNSKVRDTQLFKDFRRHTIETYIDDLREGRIKVLNTDYAVLFGNPYEMLQSAIGEKIKKTLHKGKEIYCSAYEDGEQLVAFRNPHVSSGNVMTSKNVYHEEFKEYFNLTDNIVIVNSFDNDLMDRLSGSDFDSDIALLTNSPILLSRAIECINHPTPINMIKADKIKRYYNAEAMANVDSILSENKIGEIINLSQIFNSYYWDSFNNPGKYDEGLLQEIYNCISQLSSLSQIELDKAKKFVNLDMDKTLNNLKAKKYNSKPIIQNDSIMVYKKAVTNEEKDLIDSLTNQIKSSADKEEIKIIRNQIDLIKKVEKQKNVRPMFFKYCGAGKEYSFKLFETPMDYLQEVINKIPQAKRSKNIDISEILTIDKYNLNDADRKQIKVIKSIIKELDSDIKAIYADIKRDRDKDIYLIQNLKKEAIYKIGKMKMSIVTILNIFNRIYGESSRDKEISKYKLLLLSTLWKAQEDVMKQCFKTLADENVEELQEDGNGSVIIWGKKYNVVKKIHA